MSKTTQQPFIPYKLNKMTYPVVVIGPCGTTIDSGDDGTRIITPQDIKVRLQGELIDLDVIVHAYEKSLAN